MRRILLSLTILAATGAAGAWFVLRPEPLPADALAGLEADAVRGEQVFWAGGCAACHSAEKAEGADRLVLKGGRRFPSPFGTFVAPNISNDPAAGIGTWTALGLANAMLRGVSPEGRHYYPVFPYASYARATLQDVVDLRAFLATLPADPSPSAPHEVAFPYNIRLGLGLWKRLHLDDGWVVAGDLNQAETRGRYLVEALGHCGECHTPRGGLGAMDRNRWLAGAPIPGGKSRFPNLTPAKLTWSEADIVAFLTTGFTPDYDSVGGAMAEVVDGLSHLAPSDRAAIAAYLKRVVPAE
ncbi:cytochrome c [Defluviimonas salinarum]|uniref:Cytochrome c n=1 Tax=Defluviimonas salinarum TaxID=2992147 RepID=A0ABT3J0F1_9RHOB|nr:cytochrome c [Defluviimonas salinarum]MCW3781148.1 cytochrome c [Defluviimonas salinarum]